jgi:FKBP-type peptidyl-prolyl cis-trans isomerase
VFVLTEHLFTNVYMFLHGVCLNLSPVSTSAKHHPTQLTFSYTRFGTNSYSRSRDRPGRTQQTRIFCGKALLLTSSGAREQESEQERERKQEKEQEQESKSKREKKQEQEREKARTRERKSKNKREKKHGKTPSLLRRIILRLGCITP